MARAMCVPPNCIHEIVSGKGGITAETALRLSITISGTSPEYWLGLQQIYELQKTMLEKGERIR